jgi:hypothetical protein
MKYTKITIVWAFLVILGSIFVLLYTILSPKLTILTKEGFSADRVPSGDFPREVDEPLLYPNYPKKKIGYGDIFSGNNSENNSKLYPVASNIGGYDQATNNVRDWVTPDNGSCVPAAMCGALYDAKAPDEYKVSEPLPFDIPEKRVGYYASTRL